MEEIKIEKYKKENGYSFSFGAFPTFELIKNKSEQMICLLVSSKLKETEDVINLLQLCKKKNIPIHTNDKLINKIVDKENCFIVGVFKKYHGELKNGKHLVLVNPSDMGNMGTIMRTALGFGYTDVEIIKPCVDIFNPKVVRASMGAIFSLNIVEFETLEEYLNSNNNTKFFFMLNGKKELGNFEINSKNYDLVFGNEGSGLPEFLLDYDESVVIKHSNKIDSLNLPISVGMALYEFSRNK